MDIIKPFRALRPTHAYTNEVIAPPYDVVNTAEARELVLNKPHSYLHITKPEIDLPDNTDPYSDRVYAQGATTLQQFINDEVLARDELPCYYIYRMQSEQHCQTGLGMVTPIRAYKRGLVRKHELTRPDKEQDRVNHIHQLNAQTEPVMVAYKASTTIKETLASLSKTTPSSTATDAQGITHSIWVIRQPQQQSLIASVFDEVDTLYITDGHHRSAAAARVAEMNPCCDAILAVAFPTDELKILPYNRIVKQLPTSPESFIENINAKHAVTTSQTAVEPNKANEIGMYLDQQWYHITLDVALNSEQNPVQRIPAQLLAEHILEPMLNITNPRTDSNLNFVGGIRGTDELERLVNSQQATVAFSLCATSIEDLIAIADSNNIMPPKSTWFEPKLVDGLLTHLLV